jgi:PAS domain S-box-containing protein
MVDHLDAAFARIWTLNAAGDVLELQASAGLYTHLDGPHARVPVGAFKIGRIAQERMPHLTNDVARDPRVSDPAWAEREGMVAFAGYPLIVEDRLLGVVALFARRPLEEDMLRALGSISVSISIGIQRKQAMAALKESAERYRFLAESMPQMVWTAKPDGGLDYVSRQVTDYFRKSAEDLLGEGWIAGVHPDDRASTAERWQHCVNSGEAYETEFRLHRASDDSWRWFLARGLPMYSAERTVLSWVGTCTDIHDQKQGEAALRKANRELEEFAYVSSHDLQEPLRVVNIYTHLILKRLGSDDEKLNQFAEFVKQGVARMETLLADLLTFSRTVYNEDLPMGEADLAASLEDAFSVLKTRIEESGAAITADSLPVVPGDTAQMSHVFQNLLSNALKYSRKLETPRIHISCGLSGDRCLISVRDNGIGFEPQYAERIFGLFKRLYKSEYPGTGLGLAICRRIVERHGGQIWAESEPGHGAVFHLSLPRSTPDQAAAAAT